MPLPLNTNLPLRLIGIQLFAETAIHIRKSLTPGWYPFVHTKEDIGTDKKKLPFASEDVCPQGFYNVEEGLPRITITAIAGKNGSGKSTILDILYRILNNFAASLFTKNFGEACEEVQLTRGLFARLYFEQDGVNRFIDVADDRVSYYEYDASQREIQKTYGLTDKERNVLLNRFFYTISINYSIYAFNPHDYNAPLGDNGNIESYGGEWLDYLFHKNDGYYIPLVLTPFRNMGEMNVTTENILAEQRISVLSLLYHSQKKEFLDDYVPYKLCYVFDKKYKENKLGSFRRNIRYPELKVCLDVIIEHFVQAWQKYLDEQEIELNDERSEIVLFYLAYKAVKICLTYPEYEDLFEVNDLLALAKTYAEHYKQESHFRIKKTEGNGKEEKVVGAQDCISWMSAHTINVKKVIAAILNDEGRHITAKVFQCLNYIKGDRYKQGAYVMADELVERKYEKYDEVQLLLPPPFFRSELHYKKRKDKSNNPEEITMRSMSSGEKQLLYSLSYIYYHIRNIASNKKDGKRVVGYHHVNLIFDEAELYYHPEFQRVFVKRLLERLAMCNISRSNIRSINIMIVTHSPFILSDIPESNVLYLGTKDGHLPSHTFGANIYDLLQDSFFLESDIGELAYSKINELVELYNQEDSDKRRKQFENRYSEFEFVLNHLGEAYLKKTYEYMFQKLQELYKPDVAKNMWQQRLVELNAERERLTKLLNNESGTIPDRPNRKD
jgi:predicted ATPase